jgi:molecular chaperone GrpE (heat shock protein)
VKRKSKKTQASAEHAAPEHAPPDLGAPSTEPQASSAESTQATDQKELQELRERASRLQARIDALTTELLQSRRELAEAHLETEHAVAAERARGEERLAEAQAVIDALNQSLAIRMTHALDRFPRAKRAIKSISHRIAGR